MTQLTESFNAMLDRLEEERRESGYRALVAQEAERRRVSAELHDEIGQQLTALLMQLDRVTRRAPDGVAQDLETTTTAAARRRSTRFAAWRGACGPRCSTSSG